MFTLTFKIENQRQDIKCQVEAGETVLRAAERLGIAIDAPCAGNGTCGKCRIRLISGALEMPQNPRLPYSDYEEMWRLACQSKVIGDAVVWVPATASAFKQDIATADLSSPEELARYEHAIQGIFSSGLSPSSSESCGIAIDIGTTTVAAALLDLKTCKVLSKASRGNGQIRYGADVINRIIQQMKPGGKERLQKAVREETIIPIMQTLLKDSGKSASDISRIVIAGNTTMEHLFIGADGDSIRLEPYVPEFLELTGVDANRAGLPVPPDSPVIFAPNVGSYVGGDIDNRLTGGRDVNWGRQSGGRLMVAAEPTERLSLLATALYQKSRSGSTGHSSYDLNGSDGRTRASLVEPSVDLENRIYNLVGRYAFDGFDLVSSTSYSTKQLFAVSDASAYVTLLGYALGVPGLVAATPSLTPSKAKTFTQELRLSSTGEGPLRWTVGAYYQTIDGTGGQTIDSPAIAALVGVKRIQDVRTASDESEKAIFGDSVATACDAACAFPSLSRINAMELRKFS